MTSNSVTHLTSAPYSLEQNSSAEGEMCTIVERARSMLLAESLQSNYGLK